MSKETENLVNEIASGNNDKATSILRNIFVEKIKDRVSFLNESYDVFSEDVFSEDEKSGPDNSANGKQVQNVETQTDGNKQNAKFNQEDQKAIKDAANELKKTCEQNKDKIADVAEKYLSPIFKDMINDAKNQDEDNFAKVQEQASKESDPDKIGNIFMGYFTNTQKGKEIFKKYESKIDIDKIQNALPPEVSKDGRTLDEIFKKVKNGTPGEQSQDGNKQVNEVFAEIFSVLGGILGSIWGVLSGVFSLCMAHPISAAVAFTMILGFSKIFSKNQLHGKYFE